MSRFRYCITRGDSPLESLEKVRNVFQKFQKVFSRNLQFLLLFSIAMNMETDNFLWKCAVYIITPASNLEDKHSANPTRSFVTFCNLAQWVGVQVRPPAPGKYRLYSECHHSQSALIRGRTDARCLSPLDWKWYFCFSYFFLFASLLAAISAAANSRVCALTKLILQDSEIGFLL